MCIRDRLDTVRKLRALNTGDKIIPKGGPNEEDILVIVKNNGRDIGKIKIECKNVKKWDQKYVQELKNNMKNEHIDAGMIITTAMPKDSLGEDVHYWAFDENENIIIASPYALETVYLAMRRAIIMIAQREEQHKKELALLERQEQAIKKVKKILENSLTKKYLTDVINLSKESDEIIEKMERYLKKMFTKIRENNKEKIELIRKVIDKNEELQSLINTA